MQLDDVVHVLTKGPRVEEAMWRSTRWLDRYNNYYITTSSHTHLLQPIEVLLLIKDQMNKICLLSFKED